MTKHDYTYYQGMIKDCYAKSSKPFYEVSEETLRSNLSLIDEYTDTVVDIFLSYGLQGDHEPNKYGLELENVKGYLLELRYAIVG
jgi:hypothetical protein